MDMWTIGFADRLRFPRFPSKLGKAGKCSPSPTYLQAPQPTKELMLMIRKIEPLHQPEPRLKVSPRGV